VGFLVLRPQPRWTAGSTSNLQGVTLHDLATDIALMIGELGAGKAIVLGHAFGHGVARILAVDHPSLVEGVILAAAQCGSVAPKSAKHHIRRAISMRRWEELRQHFGSRVITEIIKDASHALFPKQPNRVADLVVEWRQT
jgi:pimeloyl-ACP methyl ester carboxylesterase